MAWLFLVGAILAEVAGTSALKLSDGFTRLGPSVATVVGYVTAFVLLSQALTRGMGVSVAYGVWAGTGVALIALVGTLWLGETLTAWQVGGIALVAVGVLVIELGARH